MSDAAAKFATAFDGERLLASGPLIDVAMALKAATAAGAEGPLLAFDDATGAVIDSICAARAPRSPPVSPLRLARRQTSRAAAAGRSSASLRAK